LSEISNLHNYQGVAQRNSVAECTFPVGKNTHCRMLCHLMSTLVLGMMDNCQQQRSERHLVQTLYTGSDNDMSRRCRDPSLARNINNCQGTIGYSSTHLLDIYPHFGLLTV